MTTLMHADRDPVPAGLGAVQPIDGARVHPAGLGRLLPANVLTALSITAAVGCGLVAGLLFVFSNAIMPALRRQPPAAGIATMQSINQMILNPLFLLLFMGSALLCFVVAVTSMFSDGPGRGVRITAGVVFLVGVFVVTAAVNVPMNDELAKVVAASPHGAQVWRTYLTRWTWWNDVRAAAATVACALMAWSARR